MSSKIELLAHNLTEAKNVMLGFKTVFETAERELQEAIAEEVKVQLKDKDYGCGTANITAGAFKIKVEVKKKVSWDNDALGDIKEMLHTRGENADEYIETRYNVAESKYKNWPRSLQAIFEPARTVDVSKPTITIEEVK